MKVEAIIIDGKKYVPAKGSCENCPLRKECRNSSFTPCDCFDGGVYSLQEIKDEQTKK